SGLLVADVESEYGMTRIAAASTTSAADVRAGFAVLEARARRELRGDGIDDERCVFRRQLDLRYAGQAYEIAVPEQEGASDAALVPQWVAGFHRLHQQLYWWDDP